MIWLKQITKTFLELQTLPAALQSPQFILLPSLHARTMTTFTWYVLRIGQCSLLGTHQFINASPTLIYNEESTWPVKGPNQVDNSSHRMHLWIKRLQQMKWLKQENHNQKPPGQAICYTHTHTHTHMLLHYICVCVCVCIYSCLKFLSPAPFFFLMVKSKLFL